MITGIDGSGKTTQTELLTESLRSEGVNVSSASQFSSGFFLRAITSRFGQKLVKLEKSTATQDYIYEYQKNGGNSRDLINDLGGFFRRIIALVSIFRIVTTGLAHTWMRVLINANSSVIVFDRYFYDTQIKTMWMYRIRGERMKFLSRLIPKPTMIFYLEIDAEDAFERETDDDVTLEQLVKKKEIYDDYFNNLETAGKRVYRIPTGRPLKEVHNSMKGVVERRLKESSER